MSKNEPQRDWTSEVEEYLQLPIGESTFEILGDARIVEGDYGKRSEHSHKLGILGEVSANSPVARELKKAQNVHLAQ